ncbi:MAG: M1 family aminopeptidase [Bacteroidetes bacterium]|nr:M1 family aminopeptidase [Bacteroidota bacterium]
MKRLSFAIILLVISAGIASAQFDPKTSGAYSCFLRKSTMQELPSLPYQTNTAGIHSYDVLKYTINADIFHCYTPPYPRDFTANVKIQFAADSAINNIKLNAVSVSLQIDSVKLAASSFSVSGNILNVNLDRTYNPGEVAEIMIYYKHKAIADNAFYVSGGFVFTDCEPEGARHWFPCYDSPSDKALMELTAKVPLNVKLGSNGRLADSTISGDTLRYHWISANRVATYLMVMTSKVNYKLDIVYYHKISNPSDSIPIRFYYNAGESPYACEAIMDSMTSYYSRNWCEHPFEKNGFATLNSQFAWGGMENQTLTSFCPNCWDISLVSHEFAHQWYGDMITCATWADIWLNEGFATWSEAFWLESSGGYTSYLNDIKSYANSYLQGNPGWPISNPDWATNTPSVNVLFDWDITYCKGACVLHQLRYVLGDSLFFHVLQTYTADTNYKYKSATIGNFNQLVDSLSGQNYDWFFTEWIYTANHPVYANTYQIKNLGGGSWQVDFNARQTQTNAPFFTMPLELKVRFSDNSDTLIKVMNDSNNQLFKLFFSKQPTALYFDPDGEIVLKQGTTTVGINDFQERADVVLGQNTPNPANYTTSIPFTLPSASAVSVSIKNTLGVVVWKTGITNFNAGEHSVEANLSSLPVGVYFYTLETSDGKTFSGKMLISR